MVRALRATSSIQLAWRILAPVLVLALVFALEGAAPDPAAAGARNSVAAIRKQQLRTEASMVRADRQIKRLKAQRRNHAKQLKQARRTLARRIERRDEARAKARRVEARLELQKQVLARLLRVHPSPTGRQVADKPALRKRVHKLKQQQTRVERRVKKTKRKAAKARAQARKASRLVTPARILARKAARERAEDKLSAGIVQMLALSKDRASSRLSTATDRGFKKPARGTVSQPYGCTGFRSNPKRGSCYFHDGIDIAARKGTKVRASAAGYVAFVGRNPWDQGRRSFVVIVGHARGYETVYAHLKPVRKVRAGQRVDRGQVIGVVGVTGHTSGPHVHWEVKKHGRTVNPVHAGR